MGALKIMANVRLRAGRETGMGAGFLPYCNKTHRFLLVKRSSSGDFEGHWCGLGGGVEQGESPDEAARREAWEEAGFPEDATCQLHYIDCQKSPDFEFHNFIGVVPNEFEPKLNHEHTDYMWVPLHEFPEPIHPGLQTALDSDACDLWKTNHTYIDSEPSDIYEESYNGNN